MTLNSSEQTNIYFIFNVGTDANITSYNITSITDLITNGPMNYKSAKFGKGFINYEVEGTSNLVYLSMDLIGISASWSGTNNLEEETCPNVPISGNDFVIRNCLDVGLGFDEDELVSSYHISITNCNPVYSSFRNSSSPQLFGPMPYR